MKLFKDNARRSLHFLQIYFVLFFIERRELDYSNRLDGRAGYWRLALSVSSSIIVKDKYILNKNRKTSVVFAMVCTKIGLWLNKSNFKE